MLLTNRNGAEGEKRKNKTLTEDLKIKSIFIHFTILSMLTLTTSPEPTHLPPLAFLTF
jgi:hypothetical protein